VIELSQTHPIFLRFPSQDWSNTIMSSGSSGRDPQASLHDPKATTDMEPSQEWAARHRPNAQDKNKLKDSLIARTEDGEKSAVAKSAKKKIVRRQRSRQPMIVLMQPAQMRDVLADFTTACWVRVRSI
jgi:hypothetical protein